MCCRQRGALSAFVGFKPSRHLRAKATWRVATVIAAIEILHIVGVLLFFWLLFEAASAR